MNKYEVMVQLVFSLEGMDVGDVMKKAEALRTHDKLGNCEGFKAHVIEMPKSTPSYIYNQ